MKKINAESKSREFVSILDNHFQGIDHRIVTNALLELISSGDINKHQVVFYEDLPYAQESQELTLKKVNEIEQKINCKLWSNDINIKNELYYKWYTISCYKSQFNINDWCMIFKRAEELDLCERLYSVS